jgi:hypothetical protein
MEVYFIGYLVIPLGIFYFLRSPLKLYELTIFSIPFTGTAIFKISNASFNMEGITPSMFLGVLCLIRHFTSILTKGKIVLNKNLLSGMIALFCLALVAGLSLVMPAIISGDISVLDAYGGLYQYTKSKPLYLKFQFVTQVGYFVFGCLLAYYFALKNRTTQELQRSIQVYLYASLFVCCWGLFELLSFYLNIPYPGFLFNQISAGQGNTLVLEGRPRISSVALEPSILSQQLLTVIPLLFWPIWDKRQYLQKPNIKILLFLIVVVLLLCVSATAFIGLAAFCGLVIFQLSLRKKWSSKFIYLLLFGGVAAIFATPVLINKILSKVGAFSGAERILAITAGWDYFSQYPVLGIGWGVFPSWDLIICILTGMGIVGLFIFLWLVSTVFLNFKNLRKADNFDILNMSVLHAFIMLLIVSQASGFIFYSQYFWLVLGLSMAASVVKKESVFVERI